MEIVLLFYGQDGAAAKTKAAELHTSERKVRPIHAEVCLSPQQASALRFMPDVPDYERARLVALFPGVQVLSDSLPLPPPPPPVDPLANLAPDWRNRPDVKDIAAAVGGRAVENKKQAIEVIEAALAKRAAG